MDSYEVLSGYVAGCIGRVAEMHARYYHRSWGFGLYFEAKVAAELAGFLARFREGGDGFWTGRVDGRVVGSLAVDGGATRCRTAAHLRWFIVEEEHRRAGIGSRLLADALHLCRTAGYGEAYLWTFEGLHAARRLYERSGFRLVEEREGCQWGKTVREQRFALPLPGPPEDGT